MMNDDAQRGMSARFSSSSSNRTTQKMTVFFCFFFILTEQAGTRLTAIFQRCMTKADVKKNNKNAESEK